MSDLADEAVYQDKGQTLTLVTQCHKQAEEDRLDKEKEWKRAWRFYNSKHDRAMLQEMYGRDSWPFESSLFLPWAKEQVETNVPRVSSGLLSDDMPFKASPEISDGNQPNESEWSAACAEVNAMLCNQLYGQVLFPRQVDMWTRMAEILGTSVLLADWWLEKNDEGETEYDQLRVRALSPFDVYPDSRGKCIHRWELDEPTRFIQVVIRESVAWLRQQMRTYPERKWLITDAELDKLTNKIKPENDKQRDIAREVQNSNGQASGDSSFSLDKNVLPITIHYERDRWVWLAGVPPDAQVVLTEVGPEYPFRGVGIPMVRYMTNRIPHEFWGGSTVTDVAPLNHAANYMLNCALTNAFRSVNQTTLIDGNAELDAMISQPAGQYKVAPGVQPDRAVHVIQWPSQLNDFWRYHDIFSMETQKIGGGPENLQGVDQGAPQTARVGMGMMSEASKRHGQKVKTARECCADLGRLMWAMDKRFITEDKLVPLFGEREAKVKYVTFGVDNFKRRFQLKFDTRDKATNESLRIQQTQSWIAMNMDNPTFPRNEANYDMAKLLNIDTPSRYLGIEPTLPQYENQMLLQYGQMPEARPNHPHETHIQEHTADEMVQQVKSLPPDQQTEFEYHVRDHITMLSGVAGPQGEDMGAGGEMPPSEQGAEMPPTGAGPGTPQEVQPAMPAQTGVPPAAGAPPMPMPTPGGQEMTGGV